jgi:hypothetical protein
LIIDKDAYKHGKCWQSTRDKGGHQLIGNYHLFDPTICSPDEFLRAVPLVVAVENMHHANFLHRDRR